MASSDSTIPFPRRLLMVAAVWIGGFIAGSLMFLITDPADRRWYFLALANFPAGLLAPLVWVFDDGLPRLIVWGLWAFYLVASGYLLWIKNRRIFWYGLWVFGLLVVVNIGGCAFVIHH